MTEPIIDKLKQRRQEITEDRPPLYVLVPEYGGDIALRFRMVDWKEVYRLRKQMEAKEKAGRSDDAELDAQTDLICRACTGVVWRDRDAPDDDPSDGWRDFENPVRLDGSLGALLGFEAGTARQALTGLLGRDAAMKVGSIHGKLATWLGYNEEEVAEEFVGESASAAPPSETPRSEASSD